MIAPQMRGGKFTPIDESRGTLSPSQTLPDPGRLGRGAAMKGCLAQLLAGCGPVCVLITICVGVAIRCL